MKRKGLQKLEEEAKKTLRKMDNWEKVKQNTRVTDRYPDSSSFFVSSYSKRKIKHKTVFSIGRKERHAYIFFSSSVSSTKNRSGGKLPKTEWGDVSIGRKKIYDLRYVDATTLFANNEQEMIEFLTRIETVS